MATNGDSAGTNIRVGWMVDLFVLLAASAQAGIVWAKVDALEQQFREYGALRERVARIEEQLNAVKDQQRRTVELSQANNELLTRLVLVAEGQSTGAALTQGARKNDRR